MILNENSTVLKYMYDYSSDVLGVKVKNDFIYHETVELEDGVLLDLGFLRLISHLPFRLGSAVWVQGPIPGL